MFQKKLVFCCIIIGLHKNTLFYNFWAVIESMVCSLIFDVSKLFVLYSVHFHVSGFVMCLFLFLSSYLHFRVDVNKPLNWYLWIVKGRYFWSPLSDFQRSGQKPLFFLWSSKVYPSKPLNFKGKYSIFIGHKDAYDHY